MNRTITQEQSQLHAYVDDQLSEEELRQVEAAIQSNPEALQQVSDYQRLNEQLKALYDPILDEPIPPHLLKPRSTISLWRRIRSLAAAVVFVTLGLVTGLYLGVNLETEPLISGTEADHVIDEAAMAYSVYVPEVRHPVEVRGEQRDHLVTWLSKRMGRQINVPRLAEFDMRLVGGRLLSSEDGPGALLMYENISGSRIIIYACH
ncbi:MAG: anti-sigma factor, partial [Candidatus Thiodiazotropha sp. (ex Lucinoma borealis)]|nr:anti-sigma factor [Candidatus Thiodiazotropha sp. (ex Lucinoma borealis)]